MSSVDQGDAQEKIKLLKPHSTSAFSDGYTLSEVVGKINEVITVVNGLVGAEPKDTTDTAEKPRTANTKIDKILTHHAHNLMLGDKKLKQGKWNATQYEAQEEASLTEAKQALRQQLKAASYNGCIKLEQLDKLFGSKK